MDLQSWFLIMVLCDGLKEALSDMKVRIGHIVSVQVLVKWLYECSSSQLLLFQV